MILDYQYLLEAPRNRLDLERHILGALQLDVQLQAIKKADLKVAKYMNKVRDFHRARLAKTHEEFRLKLDTADAYHFFLNELYPKEKPEWRQKQIYKALGSITKFMPDMALVPLTEAISLEILSDILDYKVALALGDLHKHKGEDVLLSLEKSPDNSVSDPIAQSMAIPTNKSDEEAFLQIPEDGYDLFYKDIYTLATSEERHRQLMLLKQVSESLVLASNSFLVQSALKVMHKPALVLGVGELQVFLERGMRAFKKIKDPKAFTKSIFEKEFNVHKEHWGS